MHLEAVVSKRPAGPIESEPTFKKQKIELTIEERVDEHCRVLMRFSKSSEGMSNWPIYHIENGKLISEGEKELDLNCWKWRLFDFIKKNPNEPTIWDYVFKKLSLPSVTIPFGHGLSLTLPSYLWEYLTEDAALKDLPSKNKDVSPGIIQTFIQCLKACNSYNILTEENWLNILKLAKRDSIKWLFAECIHFGLKYNMGKDFVSSEKFAFEGAFWPQDSWNLNFEKLQILMSKVSKSPEIDAHLGEVIPLLYPSETHNEEYTFCFSHGQKAKLPLYIWKDHSDYFWNMANFKKELKSQYLQGDDEIPPKSMEAFVRCLMRCTAHNIINLDNFADLSQLASKYQIVWLLDDCDEFFKVHTLSQAASCQFAKTTNDYVGELIRNKSPFKAKGELDKLADQYRLLALKLFANGFTRNILSDGTLLIRLCDEEPSLLATCLAMENPWDAPKIELACSNDNCVDFYEEDFEEINEIVGTAKCPITVRLDYIMTSEDPSYYLIEMLNKYPNIKHLKIIIGLMPGPGIINSILKMIKENNTLESLHIIVHACNYKERNEEGFSIRNLNAAIKKALGENTYIKKISLLCVKYELDSTRSYITGDSDDEDETLFYDYEITAQNSKKMDHKWL